MKWSIVIGIIASTLVAVSAIASVVRRDDASSIPPIDMITLTDGGFEPRELTIRRGTQVRFTTDRDRPFWPASNLHPDHGIYPEFDPKRPIDPREEWQFRFDVPGTWGYHDHIRSYYIGTITVTP